MKKQNELSRVLELKEKRFHSRFENGIEKKQFFGYSKDYFVNQINSGNSHFRIGNFNRKIKIAKRDNDFSHSQKEARENQFRLDSFRRESLDIKYPFKSFGHCQNYILNNLSKSQKKDFEKAISKINFEKRQKARHKKAFQKLFEN